MAAKDTAKRHGTCHCGAVEFAIPADTDFTKAKRCDCTFCRRRWAPNVSVPKDAVSVIKGADILTCYQFNTGTAEHYFCSKCGIYTFHRRRSNPDEYGVNVSCFEGITMSDYNNAPIFDGINHPSDR
ncbi:MAG: GFA family protein [Parvularculales bacterium]